MFNKNGRYIRYQNFEFVEAGTEDPDLLGAAWTSKAKHWQLAAKWVGVFKFALLLQGSRAAGSLACKPSKFWAFCEAFQRSESHVRQLIGERAEQCGNEADRDLPATYPRRPFNSVPDQSAMEHIPRLQRPIW